MTINENHYHFHKEKVMAKINTTAWKIFEVCEPPNRIVLPQTVHRPLLEGPGSQGWSKQVSFFNALCLGCPNSADSLTAPFSEHTCRIRANESHWLVFPFLRSEESWSASAIAFLLHFDSSLPSCRGEVLVVKCFITVRANVNWHVTNEEYHWGDTQSLHVS